MWHEDGKLMELYSSLESSGEQFPRECPVCGQRHAHVLMHRFGPSGLRGTVRAWCDSCGGYAHFDVVVPVWWSNPEFVNEDRLDSLVDYPDDISAKIDEWVNTLLE